jgi:hypothetical protein
MSSSHHQQPLNLVPCDPSYCIPLLIPALGRFLAVSTTFPVLRTAVCRQAGLCSRRFPLPARPPILPSSWLTGDTPYLIAGLAICTPSFQPATPPRQDNSSLARLLPLSSSLIMALFRFRPAAPPFPRPAGPTTRCSLLSSVTELRHQPGRFLGLDESESRHALAASTAR